MKRWWAALCDKARRLNPRWQERRHAGVLKLLDRARTEAQQSHEANRALLSELSKAHQEASRLSRENRELERDNAELRKSNTELVERFMFWSAYAPVDNPKRFGVQLTFTPEALGQPVEPGGLSTEARHQIRKSVFEAVRRLLEEELKFEARERAAAEERAQIRIRGLL